MQIELCQSKNETGIALTLTAFPASAAERNAASFHLTPHRRATIVSVADWLRWVDCDRRGEHGRCHDLQVPAVVLGGNNWVWESITSPGGAAAFAWHALAPLTPITTACIERLAGSISFDLLDTTLQQLTAEIHLALSVDAELLAAAISPSADRNPSAGSDDLKSQEPQQAVVASLAR